MKDEILKIIQDKLKHFAKIIKNNATLSAWVNDNSQIESTNFAEVIYSAINQYHMQGAPSRLPINGRTEWEVLQDLGYDRIWDTGKIKWIKSII